MSRILPHLHIEKYIMNILVEELIKIGLSLLLGSLLGLEREYRNKPAGFRTMALICVGSTLFTMLSLRMGLEGNGDRVAANIVTGIGFIGAGVIFKNNSNVLGLTTAATIWIAAGIGMAVGSGAYTLAILILLVVLMVLFFFEYLRGLLDDFHARRVYFITYEGHILDDEIEAEMKKVKLKFKKLKEKRNKQETLNEYEVIGKHKNLNKFNEYLLQSKEVLSFEY
jgi:putative Mg2+ transporter-C (MgtC) family protein